MAPIKNLCITAAILMTVALTLFKLDAFPTVLYDEPMYANTAYTFASTGILDNNLTVHSGKEFFLYPLVMGAFSKLSPDTLLGFRKFSALLSVCSTYLFCHIAFALIRSMPIALMTIACFVTSNLMFIGGRVIRPEILGVTLSLLVVFMLLKFTYTSEKKWAFWLGACSGGLMLVHPAAVVLGVSLLTPWVVMVIEKKPLKDYGKYMIVGLAPVLVLIALFFGAMTHLSVGQWLAQVLASDKAPSSTSYVQGVWTNMRWFFDGYMMGVKRLLLVGIEAMALVWALGQRAHKIATALGITVIAYLGLSFSIFQPILRPYLIYIVPFLIILMGIAADTWANQGILGTSASRYIGKMLSKKNRLAPLLVLMVYMAYSLAGNVFILYQHRFHESYSSIKHRVHGHIQDDSMIVFNHHYFWFWNKDKALYKKFERERVAALSQTEQLPGRAGNVTWVTNDFPFLNPQQKATPSSHSTGGETIFSHQHITISKPIDSNMKKIVKTKAYGPITIYQ